MSSSNKGPVESRATRYFWTAIRSRVYSRPNDATHTFIVDSFSPLSLTACALSKTESRMAMITAFSLSSLIISSTSCTNAVSRTLHTSHAPSSKPSTGGAVRSVSTFMPSAAASARSLIRDGDRIVRMLLALVPTGFRHSRFVCVSAASTCGTAPGRVAVSAYSAMQIRRPCCAASASVSETSAGEEK